MKRTTRIVAIVMVLVMALSMLPMFTLALTPAEIVDAAYALEQDTALDGTYSLTGKVTSIDTPYNSTYKNISVVFAVEGDETKPILCYRLKDENNGELVSTLAVGDIITVTGSLKNYRGTVEFDTGCLLETIVQKGGEAVVAPSDPKQIVDEAYALAAGASLPYNATLTGTVTSIDTAYDATYKNLTFTFYVAGREDKPIVAYRAKGTGADTLVVGQIVTITGQLKNYTKTDSETGVTTSTIELVNGNISSIADPAPEKTAQEILEEAYALGTDESLSYMATLTGKVISVDDPFNPTYNNVTVTIEVEGCEDMPIKCFRLAGENADVVKEGDTITVTGTITNYKGSSVQFKQGCTLDNWVDGGGEVIVAPEDPKQIVDEAYALEPGASLPYVATLTGEVISIDEAYSEQYGNITFTFVIEGCEDKPIVVYRVKGEGADTLAVGQLATVTGNLKNYVKTDSETGVTTSTIELVNGTLLAVEDAEPDYGIVGDVTGDTKINMADVAKTFAHVRNKNKLTAEDALFRADATGDGKINMADVARIFAHVRGKNPLN